MDVGCTISGHPSSQKMLSAHDGRPEDEPNLEDDLVGGDEEYELTELKNVETARGILVKLGVDTDPPLDAKPLVHYDSPDELEHLEEMTEEENLQSTSDENYSRSIKVLLFSYFYLLIVFSVRYPPGQRGRPLPVPLRSPRPELQVQYVPPAGLEEDRRESSLAE